MVIFYHLLKIAAINAHVIFLGNKNEYCSRRDFLKQLGLGMLEDHLKRRSQLMSLPRNIKILLEKYKPLAPELPEAGPAVPEEGPATRKRKRCQKCHQDTKKTSLTAHYCEKCGTHVCLKLHAKTLCPACLNSESEDTE